VRVLRASAVRAVASAHPPPGSDELGAAAALARSVLGPLPQIDLGRAKEREARALRQAQADLAKVGVGVTREAQALFDALAKTMPCEWRQQQQEQAGGGTGAGARGAGGGATNGEIAVLECVVVRPPYGPGECAALPGAEAEAGAESGALERVRKVLKAARERLGLAEAP
jgi:protein LSM12